MIVEDWRPADRRGPPSAVRGANRGEKARSPAYQRVGWERLAVSGGRVGTREKGKEKRGRGEEQNIRFGSKTKKVFYPGEKVNR